MRKILAGLLVPSLLSLIALRTDAANVALIVAVDPNQGQFPESITADDDGNVFLSMTASVWKVVPDGHHTPTVLAHLPVPAGAFTVGLKVGFDGFIYAATGAFDPTLDASHLWRVSPDGAVVEHLAHFSASGFPNDLAFDDDGDIYVTDSALGLIYKVDAQHHCARVFLDDPRLKGNAANPRFLVSPFGANGIAFDKGKRELFVSNTDFGTILRIPLGEHGAPGPVSTFASDPRLAGVDGLAFDNKGQLYAAVNLQNQIAVLDENGQISIVATGEPLHGPSGLVFGTHGNAKKTLYISSFAIAQSLGLQPGPPQPSLDSIEVPFGGLSLP